LQAKFFKKYEESQVLNHVRSIDVNEDEQVDAEDLRRFREVIQDKTYNDLSSI
jgi:hypothetical protein